MLYPIGIQNFEKLREGGYVYVDKTSLIHKLANSGTYYFLSRPRRFGKSLLISTMEAYFKGKKELFRGLALEKLEKDWIEYPVLHLDLNGISYNSEDVLDQVLNAKLYAWETEFGICAKSTIPGLRFQNIIDAVTSTVYRPNTSIQIQFLHLLQQIQDFFFSALCQCALKHLCRAVHAGHIVSGFCHKTRQFSGPTSQIEHRSVPDSVFF